MNDAGWTGCTSSRSFPEMMRLMWTTWTGLLCLVLVVVLDVVGCVWVRKIAHVNY